MTSLTRTLPFELGEPCSFEGLTLIPLFAAAEPHLEYVGLDEAVGRGLRVSELGGGGAVNALVVENRLAEHVLLYEGEELVGAKQNRILERTILAAAGATLKIPVNCVEQGRWSYGGAFAPAPHAAYPELRRAQHEGQSAVWASVAVTADRLRAHSTTGAADALYERCGTPLLEYASALPRLDGQCGAIAVIGGRIACLDYVSRSDVFAGLYPKLLRGYTLDALGAREHRISKTALGRLLGELELAERTRRPAAGLGEEGELCGYAVGRELTMDGEVVALSAFRAKP